MRVYCIVYYAGNLFMDALSRSSMLLDRVLPALSRPVADINIRFIERTLNALTLYSLDY